MGLKSSYVSLTSVNRTQAEVSYPQPGVDDFTAQIQAAVESMAEMMPSEEEEARFDEAVNAFVGGVLRRLAQADSEVAPAE